LDSTYSLPSDSLDPTDFASEGVASFALGASCTPAATSDANAEELGGFRRPKRLGVGLNHY
jgi:hypothetical protein